MKHVDSDNKTSVIIIYSALFTWLINKWIQSEQDNMI